MQDRLIGQAIYGDPTGETIKAYSPWLQISKLDNGFDDALYAYRSRFDNVESNDRRKLTTYDPAWNVNWLWGIRFFRMTDDFTLDGSDLAHANIENLAYQTKNSFIGMQAGLQGLWGCDRIQLGSKERWACTPISTQHGTDFGRGSPAVAPLDAAETGCDAAMLFEVSAMLRYRLAKEFWLQAGYSILLRNRWRWPRGSWRAGAITASSAWTAVAGRGIGVVTAAIAYARSRRR